MIGVAAQRSPANGRTLAMQTSPTRARVIILGPSLAAISGVSAHVRTLLQSKLAEDFRLQHFSIGSEGRTEHRLARFVRLAMDPWRLALAIRRHRASIVHINTSLNKRAFLRDIGFMLMSRICGARTLVQIHGGELPNAFTRNNQLLAALLRRLLSLADAIVVLAQVELSAYRSFARGLRVILIPNAVDFSEFSIAHRHEHGDQEPIELIYLGRLAAGKGLDELLSGVSRTLARGCCVRLTIAGSGNDEPRLRAIVRREGLSAAVSFTGPVCGAAKRKLLARSEIFVLPSYSEGLPYSLLEAMAAGTAVIATPVGAIGDVVVDGIHGKFVPVRDAKALADAIEELAADRSALRRMRKNCQKRIASAFTVEQLAQRFAATYAALGAAESSRARALRSVAADTDIQQSNVRYRGLGN